LRRVICENVASGPAETPNAKKIEITHKRNLNDRQGEPGIRSSVWNAGVHLDANIRVAAPLNSFASLMAATHRMKDRACAAFGERQSGIAPGGEPKR